MSNFADNPALAVLVGNGLSRAFNEELSLGSITQKFLEELAREAFDDSEVSKAVTALASKYFSDGVATDKDFEYLVGAFEPEAMGLHHLQLLAENMSRNTDKLHEALATVTEFAEEVRDYTTSHILEIILNRSRANIDEGNVVMAFVDTVVQSFIGRITFGNLNYDLLLMSALLASYQSELADVADGRFPADITSGNRQGVAYHLRRSKTEFLDARLILLHLHGSLSYWTDKEGNFCIKIPRNFLVGDSQWWEIRHGEAKIYPAVVLTNPDQKSSRIERHPFKLAYEMFFDSLKNSDQWLIVGYSFRDLSVNARLAEELKSRKALPKVLVIDKGLAVSDQIVQAAFGWDEVSMGSSGGWLTIDRSGLEQMADSPNWKKFVVQGTEKS